MKRNFYAVIMAGGIGSRFWPLSKQKNPKQFLDVLNTGKSLFLATYERFQQMCGDDSIYVVANEDYEEIIKKQVPRIKDNQLLLEPLSRNTAPCIAYAAYKIASQNPDATMVVAPSDHLIMNEKKFLDYINKALKFASTRDVLVTLGIKPNRPDTGYGYIQMIEKNKDEGLFKVKTFTEKPDEELAKHFIESGEFLWNAGIFVWNVKSIIKAFEHYLPEIGNCFKFPQGVYYTDKEKEYVLKSYTRCSNISIDYGMMEKADNVWVLPSDFGWSDIGTWNSVFEHLNKDENNNVVKGKYVFIRDAKNCIINVSDDKLLAVNNVDNLIIVESDNIILVADKSKEQDIKHVVNEIKSKYREKFI